jgi:hypothetical protein
MRDFMLRCFYMHIFLDWDMEYILEYMYIIMAKMQMMFMNAFLLRYVCIHVLRSWDVEHMSICIARL